MLLAAPCAIFASGDAPVDRATLRGLKALNVVVDTIGQDLQKEGLSGAALRDQIESRLKDAGIPVDPQATDFVGLRILGAQAKRSPAALSLALGVYQPVILARDKEIRTSTDTWGAQSVLLSPSGQIKQSVSETLDELVAQFIAAYRSVNPQ